MSNTIVVTSVFIGHLIDWFKAQNPGAFHEDALNLYEGIVSAAVNDSIDKCKAGAAVAVADACAYVFTKGKKQGEVCGKAGCKLHANKVAAAPVEAAPARPVEESQYMPAPRGRGRGAGRGRGRGGFPFRVTSEDIMMDRQDDGEEEEEFFQPPETIPDCSKKLKTEIIAWIKQNLHRYPALASKSDASLNKMKKDDLCKEILLPAPVAAVVEQVMGETVEELVESDCVKQTKNTIVAYIRRNIELFPSLVGKSEGTVSRMSKDSLCAEVKRATENKRKAAEAKIVVKEGGRPVKKALQQQEKEAAKQAVNEFKTYLPFLLADEKAQNAVASEVVKEYLTPAWVSQKLKEKKVSGADAERILTSAVKQIFANAKEGKITLWLSNPSALAENIQRVSMPIRDSRDAINILFDRESYMLQFVQWFQNLAFNTAKALHDADAKKKKREDLLIKGECMQKARGTYVNLLLAHRELFPEVANLTASEINNLALDDLCALVVKAKAAKTKRQVEQIAQEGLLDTAPRLKTEIDSHLKIVLSTFASFFEYLVIPQYKGDDIGAKVVGGRREGVIDVIDEFSSKRYGGSAAYITSHSDIDPHLLKSITTPYPTVGPGLARYIMTDILPYGDVLSTKVAPAFATLAEFENLPYMPYNDTILQRAFVGELMPGVVSKLQNITKDLFLSPEACILIRNFLLRLTVILATSDRYEVLDLEPENIAGRSQSLWTSPMLIPEDNAAEKMIADFVWIIAGLCDWLDKKDVDSWDVYWALCILTGNDFSTANNLWESAPFKGEMGDTASAIRRKFDSVDLFIDSRALQRLTAIVFAPNEIQSSRINMFAVPVF